MVPGVALDKGQLDEEPFYEHHGGRGCIGINLVAFLGITRNAVELFLKEAHVLVPASEQHRNLYRKGKR